MALPVVLVPFLTLAAAIVGHIPEGDPARRRARNASRLQSLITRLEDRPHLTRLQRGRLEGARTALQVFQAGVVAHFHQKVFP